jgi:hypothetical protein
MPAFRGGNNAPAAYGPTDDIDPNRLVPGVRARRYTEAAPDGRLDVIAPCCGRIARLRGDWLHADHLVLCTTCAMTYDVQVIDENDGASVLCSSSATSSPSSCADAPAAGSPTSTRVTCNCRHPRTDQRVGKARAGESVPGLSISAEQIRTRPPPQGRLTATLRANPCTTGRVPIRHSQIDSPSSTDPPGYYRGFGSSSGLSANWITDSVRSTSWLETPSSPLLAT